VWLGFGSGGKGSATGLASVKSFQKLLSCPIEPTSAGSKKDPLPAKAEPSATVVPPLG